MAPGSRKTVVYVDEHLLRSARALAARTGREEHEVFEEALRRYLEFRRPALRDLLFLDRSGDGGRVEVRALPGLPDGQAPKLPDGATLSGAVLAEREERGY